MDLTALDLSRIQFAFVVTFHIIFPSFTIGLAAWLAVLEWRHQATGNPVYRTLFDFWVKIFAVSFGMGVVSGIVMAFQFGTNWSVLSEKTGPIQGPLLGYESFTAFILEATFLGVVLFGRKRVSPRAFLMSCVLVALGTTLSSFWILANNSWMQVPVGHAIDAAGRIVPTDWREIIGGHVFLTRWLHMLLAAYLTTATVVSATGAWYLLKGIHQATARAMLIWGMGLMAVFTPIQIGFGHLAGEIIRDYQPAKFAAVEGRWESGTRAPLVVAAWPDNKAEKNSFEISIPVLGSMVDSGNPDSYQRGIKDIPADERAPFLVPFYGFRIMVGLSLLMLFIGWYGSWHNYRHSIERSRWFLHLTAISFPIGWICVMAGWYTAEVGRQPWVVTGLLRTSDAVTPSLTFNHALTSLILYVSVYLIVYGFGVRYLWNLFKQGPSETGLSTKEAV